jgi:CheY-like chemotaxis protein
MLRHVAEANIESATVLVADDDEMSVRLLMRILEGAGFGRVLSTTDSTEVLEIVEREKPDLLVLDLAMPEPTGFEILEALKEIEGRPPTVVLSGHEHPAIARQATELGAASVLAKTTPREQMVECFSAAISSRG